MPSCIIIGAGISGIIAAKTLSKNGWQVTVLDKGRGIGGRMATRRIETATFDHGAQYFSAKETDLQTTMAGLDTEQVASLWHLEEVSSPFQFLRNPRWIGAKGMSSIPKSLAAGLEILTNHKVIKITLNNNKYSVLNENGFVLESDAIVCTMPAPQALELFAASNMPLQASEKTELEAINYQPCIAVMAVLNKKTNIQHPGGIKLEKSDVSWIADNFQKGISKDFGATLHASSEFSAANFDKDLIQVGKEMLSQVQEFIDELSIETYQVHRWRYSLADERHLSKYIKLSQLPSFYVGGDGFGIGNVEGAFQSGLAIANELLVTL